jgi:hypothetical protein
LLSHLRGNAGFLTNNSPEELPKVGLVGDAQSFKDKVPEPDGANQEKS